MKVTVFIAASLDGFIARKNGDIDWLPSPSGEDHGYEALMRSVDALVMGRHTFEKMLTFDEWFYGDKRIVVLSSKPVVIPDRISAHVESMTGSPNEIIARLTGRGYRHLYVDGGVTIQRFLSDGLVNRLIITWIPVLIGRGIPLFGPLTRDVHLKHRATRSYPSGLVQSEYEVISPRAAVAEID
ncbi:dihydrofolate reductase family protein [Ereboglobus luteus]|uniref:Deaminase n=1 Tax=Ereboglobus luteus TaxID=1796921 RepID=A0A2U8E0P1_9BACT|nr:dihydrofolate reductase family protein [Ereboglobus luteus]AWI08408.1 deaminase [Ereboglobus luteus]